MQKSALRPVLRYADILVVLVAAAFTLVMSFEINPHSAAWLVAIYFTTALLLAVWRRVSNNPILRAYVVYLIMLIGYLITVWILHVTLPTSNPEADDRKIISLIYLSLVGGITLPVAHFSFTLRFSDSRFIGWRILELVGWAGFGFFLLWHLFGHFVTHFRWAGYTWVPEMAGGYAYFFLLTSLYLTLSVVVPFVQMFRVKSRKQKLQLFYYLAGATPAWLTCWSNFLISYGINLYPAGGLMFMAHAGIMAYAVLKEEVFDIVIVIRRGLAYAVVSLSLGLLYAGLVLALTERDSLRGISHQVLTGALFIVIASFLLTPFLNYVQKQIDWLFFRQSVVKDTILAGLARSTASTIDLDEVVRVLCGSLSAALSPARTQIYLSNKSGEYVLFAERTEKFRRAAWPKGERLPEDLCAFSAPELISKGSEQGKPGPLKLIAEQDRLIVPIRHEQIRIGFAVLDPKRSDDPYTAADIDFAGSIAAQSAVALSSAQSFAELLQLQNLTTETLEALSVGVLLIDRDYKIIRSNSVARKIASDGDLMTADVQLMEDRCPELFEFIRLSFSESGERTNAEIFLAHSRRFLLINSRVLTRAENDSCLIVVLNDITEYREMQEASRRQEQLAKIGEMVASINHEIRNIMQPIHSQLRKLTERELHDTKSTQSLATINDRVTAIDRLLTNLKDLTQPIELRKRSLNVFELIQSVWADLQDKCHANGMSLNCKVPQDATCNADGHWLRQVLYNLIRNGLEAPTECENPAITVDCKKNASRVEITVADMGCGIAESSQRKLFQPFYTTKSEAGTGLGLNISRKIIELHNGTLSFTSEVGKGTVFTITL